MWFRRFRYLSFTNKINEGNKLVCDSMKVTFFPPFDCIHQNYVHKIRQRILGDTENRRDRGRHRERKIDENEVWIFSYI